VTPTMRRTLAVLAAVAVAFGAAAARVSSSGRADLETAAQSRSAGLRDTAADFYARAARWYLPGNGVQADALAALSDMAREAGTAGDSAFALRAWREVRGAVLGTRWLTVTAPEELREANGEIARLTAAEDRALRGDAALTQAAHLALLERDLAPSPLLSAVAVLLFAAWIGILVRGGVRGVLPDGTVRWRVLGAHVGASLVVLALWLVAVGFA